MSEDNVKQPSKKNVVESNEIHAGKGVHIGDKYYINVVLKWRKFMIVLGPVAIIGVIILMVLKPFNFDTAPQTNVTSKKKDTTSRAVPKSEKQFPIVPKPKVSLPQKSSIMAGTITDGEKGLSGIMVRTEFGNRVKSDQYGMFKLTLPVHIKEEEVRLFFEDTFGIYAPKNRFYPIGKENINITLTKN